MSLPNDGDGVTREARAPSSVARLCPFGPLDSASLRSGRTGAADLEQSLYARPLAPSASGSIPNSLIL
jgi:hypothetical protein